MCFYRTSIQGRTIRISYGSTEPRNVLQQVYRIFFTINNEWCGDRAEEFQLTQIIVTYKHIRKPCLKEVKEHTKNSLKKDHTSSLQKIWERLECSLILHSQTLSTNFCKLCCKKNYEKDVSFLYHRTQRVNSSLLIIWKKINIWFHFSMDTKLKWTSAVVAASLILACFLLSECPSI